MWFGNKLQMYSLFVASVTIPSVCSFSKFFSAFLPKTHLRHLLRLSDSTFRRDRGSYSPTFRMNYTSHNSLPQSLLSLLNADLWTLLSLWSPWLKLPDVLMWVGCKLDCFELRILSDNVRSKLASPFTTGAKLISSRFSLREKTYPFIQAVFLKFQNLFIVLRHQNSGNSNSGLFM